jgi:hypothetical protein
MDGLRRMCKIKRCFEMTTGTPVNCKGVDIRHIDLNGDDDEDDDADNDDDVDGSH